MVGILKRKFKEHTINKAERKEGSFHQYLMTKAYQKWYKNSKWSYEDFINNLSGIEREAVLVGNLNYQVENGGFIQWWDNGYGKFANEVFKVIENFIKYDEQRYGKIGHKVLAILEEAINLLEEYEFFRSKYCWGDTPREILEEAEVSVKMTLATWSTEDILYEAKKEGISGNDIEEIKEELSELLIEEKVEEILREREKEYMNTFYHLDRQYYKVNKEFLKYFNEYLKRRYLKDY